MARRTKFECDGIGDVIAKLGGLNNHTYDILKATLYEPAGILADEIRKHLDPHYKPKKITRIYDDGMFREKRVTYERTGSLADSITIARMTAENGKVSTAVVFAGYDEKGVPNAIKAAALESGTSRGQGKTPFIAPAIKAARKRASEVMQRNFEEEVRKYWEE